MKKKKKKKKKKKLQLKMQGSPQLTLVNDRQNVHNMLQGHFLYLSDNAAWGEPSTRVNEHGVREPVNPLAETLALYRYWKENDLLPSPGACTVFGATPVSNWRYEPGVPFWGAAKPPALPQELLREYQQRAYEVWGRVPTHCLGSENKKRKIN